MGGGVGRFSGTSVGLQSGGGGCADGPGEDRTITSDSGILCGIGTKVELMSRGAFYYDPTEERST